MFLRNFEGFNVYVKAKNEFSNEFTGVKQSSEYTGGKNS
jgi:hypothetical protein